MPVQLQPSRLTPEVPQVSHSLKYTNSSHHWPMHCQNLAVVFLLEVLTLDCDEAFNSVLVSRRLCAGFWLLLFFGTHPESSPMKSSSSSAPSANFLILLGCSSTSDTTTSLSDFSASLELSVKSTTADCCVDVDRGWLWEGRL